MAHKGYKQTPEHIAARIRRGADHHNWKGSGIVEKSGRTRALRMYPEIGPCVRCGSPRSERHHADGNTSNNDPKNILILCRKCHMAKDGRSEQLAHSARSHHADTVAAAAAEKRARQFCKRGHPLSGDNLYRTPDGRRVCKICRQETTKRYRRSIP